MQFIKNFNNRCKVLECKKSSVGRALHRYRRGHGFKSRTGLNFFFRPYFQLLFSVVFLAAKISHVRFFITVQIYEFHISKIIIHHLDGIFEPNILTSSQLASQLSRQSAAPVSQTSWVKIPNGPKFLFIYLFFIFRSYFQLLVSVVFLAARISYIRFFTALQIYEFHISKIIMDF